MQKFCVFSFLGELMAGMVQDFVNFLHKKYVFTQKEAGSSV